MFGGGRRPAARPGRGRRRRSGAPLRPRAGAGGLTERTYSSLARISVRGSWSASRALKPFGKRGSHERPEDRRKSGAEGSGAPTVSLERRASRVAADARARAARRHFRSARASRGSRRGTSWGNLTQRRGNVSNSRRSGDREYSRTGRRRYIFSSRSAHLGARERSPLILRFPILPTPLPNPDALLSCRYRSIDHRSRRDCDRRASRCPALASPRTRCRRLPIVSIRPRPRHWRRAPARDVRDCRESRCSSAGVTADTSPTSPHRQHSPTPASLPPSFRA